MVYNELRKDYLLDRWAVIATERGRRPTDYVKKQREQVKTAVCPMCPGNEHMTPPAVLVYVKSGKHVLKKMEKDDNRLKRWLIRVVPNLYPAFSPPKQRLHTERIVKNSNLAMAIGHHEVLIESPNHDEHPSDADIPQLVHVINGYIDRLRELSTRTYVRYVSIFRNHGLEAGASLSHAHSQIIATPSVPRTVLEEMGAGKKYFKRNQKCVFCDIIEKERKGPRLILDGSEFTVFAPYASVNPLEFWIFPNKHQTSLLEMSQNDVKSFAETLKSCLRGLKTLVNDPPYNYGFHLALGKAACEYYHWHVEVYPKLATWGGFEKSTGMFINTMMPEKAAENLRDTLSH
jgi:UDPglucose--hexose-1-phosphate uridylyltransferase